MPGDFPNLRFGEVNRTGIDAIYNLRRTLQNDDFPNLRFDGVNRTRIGAIDSLGRTFQNNNTPLQNRTSNNLTTPQALDEQTKKLFKAIEDENLEDFKKALEDGANVNAFDGDGMTPLMSIITSGGNISICLKIMMMLLLQHTNLNINIQETKEGLTVLHLAFLVENRRFVEILLRHHNMDTNVKNSYRDGYDRHCSHTPRLCEQNSVMKK